MTPLEIITAARQASNNENTTFVSDSELYTYLTFGLKQASLEAKIIEVTDSTTVSVAGTADYTLPTYLYEPKRITYDGLKLRPSTFVELDKLQSAIQNQPTQGTPRFYALFGSTITLVPTPDTAALVVKIWAHKEHPAITLPTDSILAPSEMHHYFIDYVVYRIYLKEGDMDRAEAHLSLWQGYIETMKKQMFERKRRDKFNIFQSEDQSISNVLGLI